MNSRNFKLTLLLSLLTIFVLGNVSAVVISEIEINPAGGQTDKEWVEIYNDGKGRMDISGWSIYDGLATEKKRYTFPDKTTLDAGDFYVVEFSNPVLNNDGDFVLLKDEKGKEIDKTDNLKDISGGSKTWQLCNGNWIFAEQTKEDENKCGEGNSNTGTNVGNNINNTNNNVGNEIINTSSNEEIVEGINPPKTLSPIKLGAKTIKSEEDNKSSTNKYAIYGLIEFGIILSLLLVFRSVKYKTEFK